MDINIMLFKKNQLHIFSLHYKVWRNNFDISPLQMLRLRESAVTSLTWEFGTSTTEVFSWSFRVTNTESIVWWVWLLIKLGYYSFLQPPAPPLVK